MSIAIVDASIVPVPIRRNQREENRRIKEGEATADWSGAKRAQKDVEGRWTGKRGKKYFGYKNHIGVDAEHKLIRTFAATPTSRVLDDLIDPTTKIRASGPIVTTAVRKRNGCWRTPATTRKRTPYPPAH